jgi:hypothetical protein
VRHSDRLVLLPPLAYRFHMNFPLAAAGLCVILLAIAHSAIGERLVLRPLMGWNGQAPDGAKVLSLQQRRVLRASWHLVSIFGLGCAALLLSAGWSGSFAAARPILYVTFLAAALYWLPATRGRHPAWAVLALIGALTAYG